MAERLKIGLFLEGLRAAWRRGDGYIMGATGQDPKKWAVSSWWFTQYTNAAQRRKALEWREHAARVWDCNGLAEGIYQEHTGVSINTYARMNYQTWCGAKGKGAIPAAYRMPGTAVFWGETASAIHHVAYLDAPVREGHPEGDWYLIEARGVMYGVVRTKLSERKPGYWGVMDRYFDYAEAGGPPGESAHLGGRILKNGMEGEDVAELQRSLIELGYDCGRWGVDGEFGDQTELAVRLFQRDSELEADGEAGPLTAKALEAALAKKKGEGAAAPKTVRIEGGACFVRAAPNTGGAVLGAARAGSVLPYGGETSENGWLLVEITLKETGRAVNGWVSGMYGRLSA